MPKRATPPGPRGIEEQLARADRQYQRDRALRLAARAVLYIGGAILVLFALDMALHLSAGWRRTATILYVAGVASFAAWIVYLACVASHRLEVTARRLEARDPPLGSSLINTLQLQRQAEDEMEPLTRELLGSALDDYDRRLEGADLAPLMKSPRLGRDLKAGLLAGLVIALILVVAGPLARLEWLRFVDPYGDHPPFSLTTIEIVSPVADGSQVIYGRSALVKVQTRGHAMSECYLTFFDPGRPTETTTLPMFNKGDLGFLQKIENIRTPIVVYAHSENRHSISTKRRIDVQLTPRIEGAYVTVAPPAYTGLPVREQPYPFRNVRMLAGGEITFRLQSNRPLRSGGIQLLGTETQDALHPMTPVAENEVAGAFVARESGRLRFTMTDADGLPSQELLTGSLTVTYDLPPEVNIVHPTRDAFVTESYRMEARIQAGDDYGIRWIRVHRSLNGHPTPPLEIAYTNVLRHVAEVVPFDIKQLGVFPGDIIELHAETIDTAPVPQAAVSQVVRLMVVSDEEYNQYLRERAEIADLENKYRELLNQLQDLIDEQAALEKKMAKLEKALVEAEPDDQEKLQRELDSLIAGQSELNSKFRKQAERMRSFGRENPLYDIEKEFQAILAEKAAQLDELVNAGERRLERLADDSELSQSTPGQALEALRALMSGSLQARESLMAQREALDDEILETIADLSAMNRLIQDFNRFRYLYDLQAAIAAQTRAYNIVRDLSQGDKLMLHKYAARERFLAQELDRLVEDLEAHASAAELNFPLASRGARDLAAGIREARLSYLAGRASNTMLIPDGPASAQLAERLRQDMERFFEQVCAQTGQGSQQVDTYLRLLRGMSPGQTFGQMAMSRGAFAAGSRGRSGYSMGQQGRVDLFGDESFGGQRAGGRAGRASARESGPGDLHEVEVALDRLGGTDQATEKSRRAGAGEGRADSREYEELVDAYFMRIVE